MISVSYRAYAWLYAFSIAVARQTFSRMIRLHSGPSEECAHHHTIDSYPLCYWSTSSSVSFCLFQYDRLLKGSRCLYNVSKIMTICAFSENSGLICFMIHSLVFLTRHDILGKFLQPTPMLFLKLNFHFHSVAGKTAACEILIFVNTDTSQPRKYLFQGLRGNPTKS